MIELAKGPADIPSPLGVGISFVRSFNFIFYLNWEKSKQRLEGIGPKEKEESIERRERGVRNL